MFTGYVVDVNEDFESFQDYLDYINDQIKYGGDIKVFPEDIKETKVEWDDDIDLNYTDCSKEAYNSYFHKIGNYVCPNCKALNFKDIETQTNNCNFCGYEKLIYLE